MLIEFSVSNFKSYRTQQTLSMAAEKPHKSPRCVLETSFHAIPRVLETASIYGANGSGKSNLIDAMAFCKYFILNSSKDLLPGDRIKVNPFQFSEQTTSQPCEFEIIFIHEGYLFQYGFAVDTKQVHQEWLYATPQNSKKQSAQTWLERGFKKDEFNIRKEIKGAKEIWKNETRDNALFLSTAVQRNSDSFKIPFEWIRTKFWTVNTLNNIFTIQEFQSNQEKRDKILKLLKEFDFSFTDLNIVENEKQYSLVSKYIFGNKEYTLPFEEESAGTKRLFTFAGPIIDTLEKGNTLIIDEMDLTLHPLAVKGVISLFQNPHTNKHNAQLIFTTHNTTSMSMMDRDQIWLTKKSESGESLLSSIADFEGRADEAVEKRYLSGRYGTLPKIWLNKHYG